MMQHKTRPCHLISVGFIFFFFGFLFLLLLVHRIISAFIFVNTYCVLIPIILQIQFRVPYGTMCQCFYTENGWILFFVVKMLKTGCTTSVGWWWSDGRHWPKQMYISISVLSRKRCVILRKTRCTLPAAKIVIDYCCCSHTLHKYTHTPSHLILLWMLFLYIKKANLLEYNVYRNTNAKLQQDT